MTQAMQTFIAQAKNPVVMDYEYGIPTGTARTRGYGNPGAIEVLLVDKSNFKNRNSPHISLDGRWRVRRDYGTIKGHCAQARVEAGESAQEWATRLGVLYCV